MLKGDWFFCQITLLEVTGHRVGPMALTLQRFRLLGGIARLEEHCSWTFTRLFPRDN